MSVNPDDRHRERSDAIQIAVALRLNKLWFYTNLSKQTVFSRNRAARPQYLI